MGRTLMVLRQMLFWRFGESQLRLCISMQRRDGWLTLGLIPPMSMGRHTLLSRVALVAVELALELV